MRPMRRGLCKIRSDVSFPGTRWSAGEAPAHQAEGFACQADPSDPCDGRPFASEVRLLATSPRLRRRDIISEGNITITWGNELPLGGTRPPKPRRRGGACPGQAVPSRHGGREAVLRHGQRLTSDSCWRCNAWLWQAVRWPGACCRELSAPTGRFQCRAGGLRFRRKWSQPTASGYACG